MNASSRTTQVSLVAAGPGDPGLLTVCAVGLLHDADVVVTDPECEPIARAHARIDAQILVAVDDDGNVADHADRVQLVMEPALEGRRVVRLMAGDPVLDGSLALEAAALAQEGISYDIAPGVSTVTGSAAYAGFALTGGRAREVRVVDAHDPDVDWPSLADPHATVVVLDGAERALDICRVLTIAGRDPRTPVAITRNCTTVDQRSILTTLGEVSAAVKAAKGQVGPGVLVIGEVVSQCAQLAWFENKPLYGWRVLVPRTKEQAGAMSEQLRRYGAVPIEVPTIAVEPPRTPQQMERAVKGLVYGRYQWVVFTSTNAVRAVWEKFDEFGLDSRASPASRSPAWASRPPIWCARSVSTPTWSRRASSPPPACSRSSRRTTRCSTRSTGCSCRAPTSPPRRWPRACVTAAGRSTTSPPTARCAPRRRPRRPAR